MSTAPRLCLLGLSYKTAPIELRERLAFGAEHLPEALLQLTSRYEYREAVILSTCNRVELYLVEQAQAPAAEERARRFLSEHRGLQEDLFREALYCRHAEEAAQHLFEVSGSIDSQILGETEILSQAKAAFRISQEQGTAGAVLRAVFERAFFLAKELRGDGGIGQARASVSSAAVLMAEKIFSSLGGHKVLVVGTGEMAAGIVRTLKSAGVKDIRVTSRTRERAEAFSAAEGATACPIEDLQRQLGLVDIVLVSSAAPHYLIGPAEMKKAQQVRHGRPLFFIDISVPRNVDPAINEFGDVYLYDIDDLEAVAQEGRQRREEVAARWRPRLAEEARKVLNQLASNAPGEAARLLLQKAEALRLAEVAQLEKEALLDPRQMERVARILERFQGRLLHAPLALLKKSAREGDGEATAQAILELFHLSDAAKGEAKPLSCPQALARGGETAAAQHPPVLKPS